MRSLGRCVGVAFSAVVVGLLAAVPARADDFAWTGFYFGANAGTARGTSHLTTSASPAFFNQFGTDALSSLNRDGPRSHALKAFSGGLQTGYNWQIGALVAGIETDVQRLGLTASRDTGVIAAPTLSPGLGPYSYQDYVKASSVWTLRPRAGIAFGQALAYVTGGLAVANHDVSQSSTLVRPNLTAAGTNRTLHIGAVYGAGIEYALGGHWSIKGEYLHLDLGSVTLDTALTNNPTGTFHVEEHMKTDIMRIGVNYRF